MSNAVNSKLTDFRVDDSGGTLRDISTYLTSVQLNRSAPELDTTTFQDTGRTYIPDFDGAEFSIAGNAHATAMGYLHPILGQTATVSFQYGPEGSATGKRKFTGEMTLLDLQESGQIGQANQFTARFRISGAITVGTYA